MSNYEDPNLRYSCFSEPSLVSRSYPCSLTFKEHYVVDRARVNGTTRYSHEAPAELAISSGAIHEFSISLIPRVFLKNTPCVLLKVFFTIITFIWK